MGQEWSRWRAPEKSTHSSRERHWAADRPCLLIPAPVGFDGSIQACSGSLPCHLQGSVCVLDEDEGGGCPCPAWPTEMQSETVVVMLISYKVL